MQGFKSFVFLFLCPVRKLDNNVKIFLVHEDGEEQNDRMLEDIAYLGLHYLYFTICYLDD